MIAPLDVALATKLTENVNHLIARRVAAGGAQIRALFQTLPALDPCTPGFGRIVGLAAWWCHLGEIDPELIHDQRDRVDPGVEELMPAIDLVYVEFSRVVRDFLKGAYQHALTRLQKRVSRSFMADKKRDLLIPTLAKYYEGRSLRRLGHDDSALAAQRAALALATRAEWPAMAAVIRIQVAWLTFQHEGDGRAAERLLQQSRQALEGTDDVTAKAYILTAGARIERRGGRYLDAIKRLKDARRELSHGTSDHPGLTKVLLDLAYVQRLQARRDEHICARRLARRQKRNKELRPILGAEQFLRRYDIVEPEMWRQVQQPAVIWFINQMRQIVAATQDDSARKRAVAAIERRRTRAVRLLNLARSKSVDMINKRSLGTNDMYRAVIDLDRGKLGEAQRHCQTALSGAEARKDSFQIARVKIVACQIALEWASTDTPNRTTWIGQAIEAAEAAVVTARALKNQRLCCRALTWLGLARVTDGSAENLRLAALHADEAGPLLKGAADYARDDLRELQRRLRVPSEAEQQIIAILDEGRTLVRRARTLGRAIPTQCFFEKCKKRIGDILIDEFLRAGGGDSALNLVATTVGLGDGTRLKIRAERSGQAVTPKRKGSKPKGGD